MGYTTKFTGAIKITPKINPRLVTNINTFLCMRHHCNMESPGCRDRLTHEAWPGGPKIPDPVKVIRAFKEKVPKFKDVPDDKVSVLQYVDVHDHYGPGYSTPSLPWFSLHSDVRLYQGQDCTYLAWSGRQLPRLEEVGACD